MRVSRFVVVAVIAVATTGLQLPSQSAAADALGCGDVVTSDVRLDHDIVGCPGNGLVVGADDVTIDLHGHTIAGDGVPTPDCSGDKVCDVAIDDTSGHSGLRVTHGTIERFAVGVFGDGGDRMRVERLVVRRTTDVGILLGDTSGSRVTRTRTIDTGTNGVVIFTAEHCVVRDATVVGEHGYAIGLFGVDDSRVRRNIMRDNDHGIAVNEGSRNLVQHNLVRHSGGSSIDIGGEHVVGNRVVGNLLVDNGDGIILVNVRRTTVRSNSITGTGTSGFPDTGGFGILLDGSKHTRAIRNVVTGGRGPAVWLTSLESPDPTRDTVLTRNVVNSARDGIRVDANARGTVVARNVADGNGDDGIHVDATGTTVTGNRADDNADLGIQAVSGVVDGGHDRASGNGNPAQCTGVVCRN